MSLHNIANLGKSHQKPCGSLLTILGELSGVDKSTTSRLITKTIRAIARLHSEFIEMPSNADVQRLRESFYNISKFPRCIEALDCTHIRIQSPGGQDAGRYRNRKGFFSHNVRVVCDSDVEAITVAAAVLHNVACMMNDAEPRVTNDEEAAVQLTININNNHVEAGNPNVTENNLSRHLLINGHFAGL
ncbi:hypothetical protein QE152_g5860 [Popillia japonica]|uniref:Nuclease HARBI1 n=1 Tax=Popillia japonica TaxID=7064 RepID=A0AAW1MGW7_POPJA